MHVGARKAALLAMPGRRPNPGATPALRRRAYYHGTPDTLAPAVLETWTIQPRAQTRVLAHRPRSWLDPVAGRVYLAPDIARAARYMRGKLQPGPVGLIVEIDGRNLGEIHPDEDDVGLATYTAGTGRFGISRLGDVLHDAMWHEVRGARYPTRTPLAERILDTARRVLTRNELDHVMGDAGPVTSARLAKIGKKLLPHLSDEDQIQLMELGTAIANIGPVPISRAMICPTNLGWDPDFEAVCTEVVDPTEYMAQRLELLERVANQVCIGATPHG